VNNNDDKNDDKNDNENVNISNGRGTTIKRTKNKDDDYDNTTTTTTITMTTMTTMTRARLCIPSEFCGIPAEVGQKSPAGKNVKVQSTGMRYNTILDIPVHSGWYLLL